MTAELSDPRQSEPATFPISPLIRLTLLSLYGALTLPLPFLARVTVAPVPPELLWLGMGGGAIALYGALAERVVLDESGIRVVYPLWVPSFFRRGWELPWTEITALKPRSTGQGGLVYYFLDRAGQAYLLPMRVVGFARMGAIVQARTGIEMTDVYPLSQPWMYLILLGMTVLLLLMDGWVIWNGVAQG
ncbi:hypothetical protein BST81_22825 [Leptolyngbya sp. 'hensonii']|uniref:hypothetical protein n=1 Tax=Leptolyngbya sp. 'hensonii' TaxID=1922337 RepID=UPI00094FEE3F|nr:hypothetical protein [Leptolyngbya sp. 'hensonii']OLP16065.1 hypothetical protein BST81_22825 [Leptolyngbya sp. 'hensonii']